MAAGTVFRTSFTACGIHESSQQEVKAKAHWFSYEGHIRNKLLLLDEM